MKSQTRTSLGEGTRGRLKLPLGLLGTLMALFSVLALLGSSAAMADENDNGCKDPTGPPTSNLVAASFAVSGNDTTYKFESADTGSTEGVPGLIKYCVFPSPNGANTLPSSVVVDTTPGTGAQGWDGTFFSDPAQLSAFSFDRNTGDPSNIPLDGTTRTMGTATWSGGAPTEQAIVLHINDEGECNDLGENSATCWVLPGELEEEEPPAADLTASKEAHPSLTRTYKWEIEKDVDQTRVEIAEGKATFNYTVTVKHDEGTDSGWLVTGEIEVNNPNSGDVTGVDIEDAINDGGSECTVEAGTNATIPAEESVAFPYECTYTAEPESPSETNTAIVSWGEQTVDGQLLAEGEAEAEAAVEWGEAEVELVDEEIEVNDSLHGFLATFSYTDPSPETFEYSEEFEGVPGTCTEYENEATFVTNDNGFEGSDEKTVEVCVGADLEVEKDAAPAFKRKFPWSITKNVDKTEVTTTAKNATFKYTIEVTKGEGEDSDWVVTGKIKVHNPNDWESIPVNVSDAINDANAICTVEGETSKEATIPIGESEEFEYECTYSSKPETEEQTNTATATWDPEAASTPNGSATGTAAVDWTGNPATEDNCVKVTDTVDGVPTTLDDPLCESKTYTPSLTFPVPSGCVTHNNTAEFVTDDTGTTGNAKQSVRVCGPVDSGALTIGYWQNKNGQKIITDGKETSKVCNSGTWLRQYNPFKDLSATATCKQVADYVTSIIKAANAGGAAMNAMLKAQMLATSLDVYFSDPALGGNKIGAPNPLGGQKINLTKVCKNIPACTTLENTSAAFGGATSLNVSQILAYAASQSNSGGTTWYGQVKATQELAKDTFDAINNEVAFEP
jgi:hypothetical protein